jgi:signal transduction histidine kinase
MFHKLLQRQLTKHFQETWPETQEFKAFCSAVNDAYVASDADRELLERSIELASAELLEQNLRLERDLAEIKRLELELRQAEKLRAVGQLASGVAHEINTPIQYVGDSLHFIKQSCQGLLGIGRLLQEGQGRAELPSQLRRLADEVDLAFLLEEVPRAIEQVEEGVRRVASIVSAMKDFGRPESKEVSLVSVNHCLESTLLVAQNELKQVACVELVLGEVPQLSCYPSELNQALLALLVNAGQAIGARYGDAQQRGLIRAQTRAIGNTVEISVSDNGIGIRPEHQARVFEPFFTTKPFGQGSGQGLAIAHAIVVQKHGGTLTFESEPGAGTTFFLRIPIARARESTMCAAPTLTEVVQ